MKTHPATKIALAALAALLLMSSFAKCQWQYLAYQQMDDQFEQSQQLQEQMMQEMQSMSGSGNPYATNPYVPDPYMTNPYSAPNFNHSPGGYSQYPQQYPSPYGPGMRASGEPGAEQAEQ